MKTYLGDSVYADFDGWAIVLTTENGEGSPSNRIVLEGEVFASLEAFVQRVKQARVAALAQARGE